MKKFAISVLCFLTLSSTTFGLLAPLEQGIAEIKAILSSNELRECFSSGEVIQGIVKQENNYLIRTNESEVVVLVVYKQVGKRIGPAEFDLRFEKKEPLPKS